MRASSCRMQKCDRGFIYIYAFHIALLGSHMSIIHSFITVPPLALVLPCLSLWRWRYPVASSPRVEACPGPSRERKVCQWCTGGPCWIWPCWICSAPRRTPWWLARIRKGPNWPRRVSLHESNPCFPERAWIYTSPPEPARYKLESQRIKMETNMQGRISPPPPPKKKVL